MNFYSHHIGDFNNATRHLTRVERALYRDLIDMYYDTEQPLITGFESLARRVLARDEDEKVALKLVLDEFFTLESDGYHNKRCDKEIAAYKRMAEGGKRGAEKRWGKAEDSPPIATPSPPHAKANANHEPITNNQLNTLSGNPDPVPEKPKKQTRTHEADEVLVYLNDVCGSRFKPVAANINLITARLREGATVDDMKIVIDRKHTEWFNDDTMRKYLRPETLFNATKFAGYLGAAAEKKPAAAIPFDREAYEAKKKAEIVMARKAYAEQEARYTVPPVSLRA